MAVKQDLMSPEGVSPTGVVSSKDTLLSYKSQAPYQPAKDEPYMSAGMKTHFLEALTSWKHALMTGVDTTLKDMKESTQTNQADPADQASQAETFSLELRTRDRERKLIKKIDEALRRLEMADYGYCDECGVEIGLRRLEARPTATLCIDCKTIAEVRERRE